MQIRLARENEVERVQEIEDLAGVMYAECGIPADLPGMLREDVLAPIRDGLVFVACDERDVPIAFAVGWLRPDAIHLRELGVHPSFMRQRIGARLIERVCEEASQGGLGFVTLTTFTEVPWNGPYYERCGFTRLADDALPGWLREIRQHEVADGLDRWPRGAMQRVL